MSPRHRRAAVLETGALERRRRIQAAAIRRAPPTRRLPNARLISETAPDRTSSHCAKAASAENPPQTARYAPAKTDVGARTAPRASARRASALYKRIIGAADGNIIATIIRNHMTNALVR